MICAAAVLHNLLIDIGDNLRFKFIRTDKCRQEANETMDAFSQIWDRTKDEIDLAKKKRNTYADRFYRSDNA